MNMIGLPRFRHMCRELIAMEGNRGTKSLPRVKANFLGIGGVRDA